MFRDNQASHEQVPPPTRKEAKDTEAPGPRERAGLLQDMIVRARPVRNLPIWSRYVLTTLIVFACFALRYSLEGIYPYPFLLFLPSVIAASFLFDRGTGFFASFLSALLAFYFFMEPNYSFGFRDVGAIFSIIVYFLIGMFTASVIEALRVTVDELGKGNDAVQNSEARYRAIFDTAVDAVIVIDEKGIMRAFNPAAEQIFGYLPEEAIGENVKKLMPSSEAKRHDGYINNYLKTGERKIIGMGREVTGLSKSGMLIPLDLSIAEWYDSDGTRYFTGVMRNISDRKEDERMLKQVEEDLRRANKRLEVLVSEKSIQAESAETKLFQAQKMEAVGQAVSILAHDFKNILNPILGAVDLIKNRVMGDEKTHRLLDMIISAGNDGKIMVEDVLAFSQKKEPKPQIVKLNDILRENEEMLRQSAKGSVALHFHLDQYLPSISVDQASLLRAITNLVVNARDAMPRGGIVTLETGTNELDGTEGEGSDRALPGTYVRLTVRDTGIGMTPDILNKVFEPFFTTKPIGKGTGLGLSMVIEFIRQSGGRMTIESAPGRGTSMNLFLPVLRKNQ